MIKSFQTPVPRDRSPLQQALSLTRRTLSRDAAQLTPAEMAWLFERPTLWLRAVQIIQHEVQRHAREANAAIKALRGGDRAAVPEGYAEAKAEYDRARKSRTTFLSIVEAYHEDVKAIVGPHALHAGDVISLLTEVAALIDDDDVESGLDLILVTIEKWGKPGAGLRAPSSLKLDTNQP